MSWDDFDQTVAGQNRGNPMYGCGVCKLLKQVEPKEAEVIRKVLADDNYSTRAIHRAFKDRDFPVGLERIGAHRRGQCS